MPLKIRIVLFSTFNCKETEKPKIFLWPVSYFFGLTYFTKVRCLQKNNIGHTTVPCCNIIKWMKNFSDSFFFSTHRSNSEQMSSQANAIHIEFKGFLNSHKFKFPWYVWYRANFGRWFHCLMIQWVRELSTNVRQPFCPVCQKLSLEVDPLFGAWNSFLFDKI